jgi:hypothetical protein
VAVTFSKASCIAVGAFNIYIIQPEWLTKVEILGQGEELLVETNFSEPGFRFRSQKSSFLWTVSPTRIVVESTDPSENCGAMIARVLGLLPHTPLQAIGNNAFYAAPLEELAEPVPETPAGYEITQRSLHTALRKEGAVYNVQRSITKERISFQCNVHFDLKEKSPEFVQACAKKFFDNRIESEVLLCHIFKVQIEQVIANI